MRQMWSSRSYAGRTHDYAYVWVCMFMCTADVCCAYCSRSKWDYIFSGVSTINITHCSCFLIRMHMHAVRAHTNGFQRKLTLRRKENTCHTYRSCKAMTCHVSQCRDFGSFAGCVLCVCTYNICIAACTSCSCMFCPSDERACHSYCFRAPHMSIISFCLVCILCIYLTVW